jgi:hypothetical protein
MQVPGDGFEIAQLAEGDHHYDNLIEINIDKLFLSLPAFNMIGTDLKRMACSRHDEAAL